MLDFQAVRDKKITLQELVQGLNREDLRRELSEVYETIETMIRDGSDADVTFQPSDPAANDPNAVDGEAEIAWTLGHVIVHLTASMEESASLAQELARGVEFHGRSRWEVPFHQATSIGFCLHRLAESRRISLASLDMWPDSPHLENMYVPIQGALPYTPVSRFASGLKHASDHLGQIAEILHQAREAGKNAATGSRPGKAPV